MVAVAVVAVSEAGYEYENAALVVAVDVQLDSVESKMEKTKSSR